MLDSRETTAQQKHGILLSSLPTCCGRSISSSVSTMKKRAGRLKFNCGVLLTDAVIQTNGEYKKYK